MCVSVILFGRTWASEGCPSDHLEPQACKVHLLALSALVSKTLDLDPKHSRPRSKIQCLSGKLILPILMLYKELDVDGLGPPKI